MIDAARCASLLVPSDVLCHAPFSIFLLCHKPIKTSSVKISATSVYSQSTSVNTPPFFANNTVTNMCVDVSFVCPCCGAFSGKSETHAHHNPGCENRVAVKRLMQADHFNGWFCSTLDCGYSRWNQDRDDEELEAIKSQNKFYGRRKFNGFVVCHYRR
jgi:hypothetical protein